MRAQTVIFGFAILSICLVNHIDAQEACTAPNTPAGCIDCTLPANSANPVCATTAAATTTVATDTTTTVASATTTTVASTITSTTASSGNAARRRLLRRLRYLRRSLIQCRRNAANQRAALLKKIQSLSANNSIKNKFFG